MGAVCCRPTVSPPRAPPAPLSHLFRSPSTSKETSISFTLSSCDVSAKALSERYSPHLPFSLPTRPPLLGPNGPAQTNPRALRPQVHQQIKVRQDESRRQHHTRAASSRRSPYRPPLYDPSSCIYFFHRSIIPLSSTSDMPSRMTTTVSLSSISCSAGICAVCSFPLTPSPSHPLLSPQSISTV